MYSITAILDTNWTLLMSFRPLKILISIHISSVRSACTSEKINHGFSQCNHYFAGALHQMTAIANIYSYTHTAEMTAHCTLHKQTQCHTDLIDCKPRS